MQLDECIALPAEPDAVERAMLLSLAWAERSKAAFGEPEGHALFGIVQGGDVPALRLRSAEGLTAIGFDGYAIGGLAVGEPQEVMLAMLEETVPALPADRPRYLMGVGTPDDILESVRRGIDMFDCVLPTRAGRHGLAYTRFGKINLKNARHAEDPRPLDEDERLPGDARLFARLSAPPREVGRGARRHAADVEQPPLLPVADGGGARGDRGGELCGLCGGVQSRVGLGGGLSGPASFVNRIDAPRSGVT